MRRVVLYPRFCNRSGLAARARCAVSAADSCAAGSPVEELTGSHS